MNQQDITNILSNISGQLRVSSEQDKAMLNTLYKSLSDTQIPQSAAEVKSTNFSFEKTIPFSIKDIGAAAKKKSDELKENIPPAKEASEYKAFIREVPISSTLLPSSQPDWANGAIADHTVGPFLNKDGRSFWFDFFKFIKLVGLYKQGDSQPSLLFKINTFSRIIRINHLSYSLEGDTIWINSKLLADNAPAGYYTGLKIKGGKVTFNIPTSPSDNKFIITPATTVQVELQLQQPAVADADDSSNYGIDAKKSSINLPETLVFHFSGQGNSIDSISSGSWKLFGQEAGFQWNNQQKPSYDENLKNILVPFIYSNEDFQVTECSSPFHTLSGQGQVKSASWALPSAHIDVNNPLPAAGIGAWLIYCSKGLKSKWIGLEGGDMQLQQPYLLAGPGIIIITDLSAGNLYCHQVFKLWKDEQNKFGTTIDFRSPQSTLFTYTSSAQGSEVIAVKGDADTKIDRPVTVRGEALTIHSKDSLLMLAAGKNQKLIYLFDDNILSDNINPANLAAVFPKPISLALHNALFKVTPVNGCLLFGQLADDFIKVKEASLYLSFGLYAYLPTLPDPYAADLGLLRRQYNYSSSIRDAGAFTYQQSIHLILICQIQWKSAAADNDNDEVNVSFRFAPLPDQQNNLAASQTVFPAMTSDSQLSLQQNENDKTSQAYQLMMVIDRLPDYGKIWDDQTSPFQNDYFSLLDISTNADLLGVSFNVFDTRRMAMIATYRADNNAADDSNIFPLQIKGMDVVSNGSNVKAFTVPQISWEPVINLTEPSIAGDPDAGFNYYPDDGGPTHIINNSKQQVALSPIPLTDFLVNAFDAEQEFAALTLFTLPFGMKAAALLRKEYLYEGNPRQGTKSTFNAASFANNIKGARQLQINAGEALVEGESNMFMGSTLQINNILDLNGNATADSTLGASVTKIFNNEFLLDPFNFIKQRGVPLTRMDLSGYGASIFSNWLNPKATIAATSQAKFDVFTGRCAHEIIQVKSILYPWAIKVVRTITLFRVSTGYAYRYDTGWKAESNGQFDFTYYVNVDDAANPGKLVPVERQAPYEIHPGVLNQLTNIQEITETEAIQPFKGKMAIANGGFYTDENGKEQQNTSGTDMLFDYELQPVYFNADIAMENPVSGFIVKTIDGQEKKLVPSKQILGFVQIAPRGIPITTKTLADLISRQQGAIGGAVDCVMDIHQSGQQMRVHRFDVQNSFASNGTDPIFSATASGNVILPKDGSWSMVKHQYGTGEVNPVPEDMSVPLIRIGKLIKSGQKLILDTDPALSLLRIANPTELLRSPVDDTINFGFLQSTDTQKALFLTPSFKQSYEKLMSKTPPLFVDAFRIVSSKGIFPNIGNAVNDFGDAISLFKNGNEFVENALEDGGKKVLELMQVNNLVAGVKQEGYKLLKNITDFDLPSTSWPLINIENAFKIYIEYKADKIQKKDGGTKNAVGSLDFDVDSFASNLADTWKSRMSNVAMVVDLGPIDRLMTIKGNWDAAKGTEAQYKGDSSDDDFPSPQIEFSKELQPVIDILQILQDLQGENYKDAFQKGLKLAMSNKAGSWEYKFEAAKEIPCVRFPMPNEVYNQPTVPLKLEAGIKLGAYFNGALMVTTDPKQLLPTAGGYLEFYGKLSVMCVSLAAATIYAVGQINLRIAADTKTGPSLTMKFGFGAQIVVGLPVVGNVSVLYMVGTEIYVDSNKLNITASMLFKGHAELLGGLVSVTITIEAKGTISRQSDRTDLAAQVTFGLDISIFLVIDISFSTSWEEQRQIA